MPVSLTSQELVHRDVIGEGSRRTYDLVEVRRKGEHLFEVFVEFLGRSKIVRREDQCRPRAQFLELLGLALRCRLDFHINELAPCGGGLVQNVKLRSDRTAELASACRSSASGNDDRPDVAFEKALNSRNRQPGPGKVVQPELQH